MPRGSGRCRETAADHPLKRGHPVKFLALLSLSLFLGVGALPAQGVDSATTTGAERSSKPVDQSTIERALRLRDASPWLNLPDLPAESGPLTIASGERRDGPVVVEGRIEVLGTIEGDAVSLGGDLLVQPGGVVTGRAVAVAGEVRVAPGGRVAGTMVSLRGADSPTVAAVSGSERTRHALVFVLAWLAIVIPIGVGVLVFAGDQLEAVTQTLARSVGRSFLLGLAGEIALIPVLLLLIVALAITLIGVLLIPIAIVAYTIVAAGLLMLGFLAVARLLGGALGVDGSRSDDDKVRRQRLLRAVLVGVVMLFIPWLLAAALTAVPVAAGIVHGMAMLLTWVALTAGFGAVIRSRAGRRRTDENREPVAEAEDEVSWQTPTPVGGVVAARRPTPASSSRSTQ